MASRKPTLVVLTLDGTNESPQITVPRGTKRCTFSPRASTTVQFSLVQNGSNQNGLFASLVSGQSFTFDVDSGDEFEEFKLYFFAAAAVTVDIWMW